MKVADVFHGEVRLIDVRPTTEPDFGQRIQVRAEVVLQFSEVTSSVLVAIGNKAWPVEGATEEHATSLVALRDRNLPRLVWAAATQPRQGTTAVLSLQVHEFPSRHYWPDPVDIGVDEKIVEYVRQKQSRLTSVGDVLGWLTDKVLLPIAGERGESHVLFSGSPSPLVEERAAFRLHGQGIAVDVMRGKDNRLSVTRIVEARRAAPDERRPILLLRAALRFCDITIAGQFRGTARSQLDQLVEQAGSYLNVWKEYNALERESVLRRARALGWLRYSNRRALPDGRWRFFLTGGDQYEAALGVLRDAEDLDLEAATSPPPELQGSGAPEPPVDAGKSRQKVRIFAGAFIALDAHRKTIDLQPPVEKDDVEPPPEGVLFVSLGGDRKRLERRERAHSAIAAAECPMPQLGLLVEGVPVPERRRKTEEPLSAAARAIFGGEPTARQIEALRVALNTPDIALIQGPPGTGKTKTIAALEVRLAELTDTSDLAGQTLLTSYQHDAVENAAGGTMVFGLPAIKVGRKRGQIEEEDGFDRWRRERVEGVRADLAALPERPATEVLRRVRNLATVYVTAPAHLAEASRVLATVADLATSYLPPSLLDRLLALRQELRRGPVEAGHGGEESVELALRAVRALRCDAVAFADDGPRNALRALRRLEPRGVLQSQDVHLITAAATWVDLSVPPFLAELKALQGRLIDRLTPDQRPAGAPQLHGDVETLLAEVVDALYRKVRESAAGEDAVLYDYLNDLESDVDGLRDAVRNYTVVLAATCQQAVGHQMCRVKGVGDTGGSRSTTLDGLFRSDERLVFTNVIVDEAARANPLDLFIPMAHAERRIILVGDHRQLPHILEPDVEAQLEQSVSDATRAALRRSLFERLFRTMREREAVDRIKRTVTLDVQYRMHPVLGDFVSDTFYKPHGEAFRSGRPAEDFPHDLDPYRGRVAAWVNIPLSAGRERGGQSKRRSVEARWIAKEVKRLASERPDLNFGIISFYAAQVDEILEAMEPLGLSERTDDGSYRVAAAWRETRDATDHLKERLRVGTVDAFQGKEFDVVMLSMTRCNDLATDGERALRRRYGHLMLENRLCVAMSRQQRLLVVVGDEAMLRGEAAERAVPGLLAFYRLCGGDHGIRVSA